MVERLGEWEVLVERDLMVVSEAALSEMRGKFGR